MDFVSDKLYNGKRFRALTILDMYSRESLDIFADKSTKGEPVACVLDELKEKRGLPKRIKFDNGPEFISRALDAWAYFNKVKLDYSRPGRDGGTIAPKAYVTRAEVAVMVQRLLQKSGLI